MSVKVPSETSILSEKIPILSIVPLKFEGLSEIYAISDPRLPFLLPGTVRVMTILPSTISAFPNTGMLRDKGFVTATLPVQR